MRNIFLSVLAISLMASNGHAGQKTDKSKQLNAARSRSITSLEADLKIVEEQNKAGIEELAQYKRDVAENTAGKLELLEKIEKAQAEKIRLQEKINLEKNQAHIAENESSQLNKASAKLKLDIQKLEAASENQEDAMKKSRERLSAARSLSSDMQKQKEKMQASLARSQDERQSLTQQAAANAGEIKTLRAQIAALKSQLQVAVRSEAKAKAGFKTTNAELAQIKALNQKEQAKVKVKEDSIADLNRLIRAGKEEVERAKKEHEELIQRGQKADADKPRLQMQAAQLKDQYKRVTSQTLALQKGR